MARPWGGSWAQEAEQAEAEAKAKGTAALPAEFPSLVESNATKPKKKKATTVPHSVFTTGIYVGRGPRPISDNRGLSVEEMMMLPSGPRDRSNEEMEGGGLGGGFRDYGGNRSGGFGDRGGDRDREGRGDRGFGGGFDRDREDRRGMGRDRDPRDDGPSRADEADNWGATKKASLPSSYVGSGGGGGGRGGGGYDDDRNDSRGGRLSDRDLPSRADEDANWGTSKKFVPLPAEGFGDRRGGRGGGFEDRRGGGGFEDAPGGISRADEVSNWGAAKKSMPTTAPPERRVGGFDSSYRDAGPEADRWSRREGPAPRDELVRPAERPRLVLQPRTIPVDSLPLPLHIDRNGENERPHSSHSTRSDRSVAVSENSLMGDTVVPKSKPRSNPFGAARPREEILAEKGQDWRKIDAELDSKAEKFSRPSSSHSSRSSRPQTPEVGLGEGLPKSRSRVSPFGDARPRERDISYEERGNRDWRKFDVDLHDRPVREQVKAAPEDNNVQIVS